MGSTVFIEQGFRGEFVIFRIFLFRALRLQELPGDGWAVGIMGEPELTGHLCLRVRWRSGS